MTESSVVEPGQDLQVREMPRDGMREFFLTCAGTTAAGLGPTAVRLEEGFGGTAVAAQCLGPAASEFSRSAMDALLTETTVPLTWVLGESSAHWLGGIHLHAVADAEVTPLVLDGEVVGTLIGGRYADECMLGGIHAQDTTVAAAVQARTTYERMEQALALAGMDFSHVARTWLYLDDILSWYGDFNRVRTAFYTERGVFDGLVPASTGIGAGNPHGAAMVAGVYAVRAIHPEVTAQAVVSPLQCPALEYGSSFSRAVEVAMPDLRRLFISGSASIAPDGKTQHVGNVAAQTARTCEVIAAILESRGMGWNDVTRATAYVRFREDARVFEQYCAAVGMPSLPVIVAHNVICRGDLLFELEVDAVEARSFRP
jgi:enamine deaminase RidA (YjgF/YER057c/UK114 family)